MHRKKRCVLPEEVTQICFLEHLILFNSKLWIQIFFVVLILSCFTGICGALEDIFPFPESHFVDVDGLTFHVRPFAPSYPPRGKVLFIHGLGGSTFSWRYAPQYLLPQGWFLVLVDLPGFGYSTRKGAGSTKKQAERLWTILRTLEEKEYVPRGTPWFLVGHSMGGGIALLMSMEHPEKVAGTVLIAPAFGRRGLTVLQPLSVCSLLQGFFGTLIRRALLSPRRAYRFLASAYGRTPTEEEFLGYLRPLQRNGTSRALLAIFLNASYIRLSAFEGKPHPPFLVLLGKNDSWTKKDTKRFLENFPETSFFVIPGAAHCPMETHPEECFPYILDFFAQQESGNTISGE